MSKGRCIALADLNWKNKELIGKGKFGCVYRTDWYTHDVEGNAKVYTVAVKCPKKVKKKTILAERDLKSQLFHSNIVNILGFAQLNNNQNIVLVFEYTNEGTLYDYIWDRREEGGATAETMMRIACEIARGMEYLHKNSYVHGDLALHNCIMDADGIVKIGDVGLYDDQNESCYFTDSRTNRSFPCPVRWMAPENLPYSLTVKPHKLTRKQHSKSYKGDVWAFGVVLYELWTRAEDPFEGCDNDQMVCRHVLEGGTAATWNSRVYMRSSMKQLMQRCWNFNPNQRPNFSSIVIDLDNLLRGDSDEYEYSDSEENEYSDSEENEYSDSEDYEHSDECKDSHRPDDVYYNDLDYGGVYDDAIDYGDVYDDYINYDDVYCRDFDSEYYGIVRSTKSADQVKKRICKIL